MGLDITYNCWHGAYSAFARWRQEIARAAGYKIDDRGGYNLPWELFEAKNYFGEWDTVPGDDPLVYLLAHSDCDGVIHPEQGIHIAARLEQLLPLLDESKSGGHVYSMRGDTEQFISGLRAAAKASDDVEFG